jgi:hypothetical protein
MPNVDHSPDFWVSVADTFKAPFQAASLSVIARLTLVQSNPRVIFDLYNEPYPWFSSAPDSPQAWDCWKVNAMIALLSGIFFSYLLSLSLIIS